MKPLKSAATNALIILRDVAGIGGVVLISFGAWLVYHPLGFIAAGVFLLVGAWQLARSQ